MTTTDINAFKGNLKNAVYQWLSHKVDEMFPDKPKLRVVVKNGINNGLSRHDDKMNGYVDTLFLFFGNESGEINSDTLVDRIADILGELKPTEYEFAGFKAIIGNGDIELHFPHNAFVDMVTGDLGGYRFTTDDVKEIKNYFNQ